MAVEIRDANEVYAEHVADWRRAVAEARRATAAQQAAAGAWLDPRGAGEPGRGHPAGRAAAGLSRTGVVVGGVKLTP